MVCLVDTAGVHPLPNLENLRITHLQSGRDTCSFILNTNLPEYALLREEGIIRTDDNEYLIKKIDDDKIDCELNFDFLKQRIYRDYFRENVTLASVLAEHLPTGWTVDGVNTSQITGTIDLETATDFDVLMKCDEAFGTRFVWHLLEKRLVVARPDLAEASGVYVTTELNIRKLNFKGRSTSYASRLYAYGKDGLTIAKAIVDGTEYGLDYIEDRSYCDKLVVAYMTDESCDSPQELYEETKRQLASMAAPVRSYECDIVDLAKQDSRYAFLDFAMHKVVSLLDAERHIAVNHVIVRYDEYPDEPDRNKVTLSCEPGTIQSTSRRRERNTEEQISHVSSGVRSTRRSVGSLLGGNSATAPQTYWQETMPGDANAGDFWFTTGNRPILIGGKTYYPGALYRKVNGEWVLAEGVNVLQNSEGVTRLVQKTGIDSLGQSETLYSRISQTAESIESEVTRATDAEGLLSSRITQTADSITAEVSRAQSAEDALSSRITLNANSITAIVSDIGDLDAALEEANGDITLLEGRLAGTQATVDDHSSRFVALAQWQTDTETSISSLEEVSTEHGTRLTALSSWKNDQQTWNALMETRATELESQATLMASDIEDLESALADANGDITALQGNLAGVQATVDGHESKLVSIAQWQSDTSTALTAVTQKADDNEASIQSLTSWKDDTVESIASITQRVSNNESSISSVTSVSNSNSTAISSIRQWAGYDAQTGELGSNIALEADLVSVSNRLQAVEGVFSSITAETASISRGLSVTGAITARAFYLDRTASTATQLVAQRHTHSVTDNGDGTYSIGAADPSGNDHPFSIVPRFG